MKKCTECEQYKELDKFGNRKDNKTGKNTKCKECVKKRIKKYKEKNRDKCLEQARRGSKKWRNKEENKKKMEKYRKRYRSENLEKCRERSREWNRKNKERCREAARLWRLNNPERNKRKHQDWIKNNPEKNKERQRRDSKKRVKTLTDRYIKQRIKSQCDIDVIDIPQEMIILKRKSLIAKRLIKKDLKNKSDKGIKVCKICGKKKKKGMFQKNIKMKDGYNNYCKKCIALKTKLYRLKKQQINNTGGA